MPRRPSRLVLITTALVALVPARIGILNAREPLVQVDDAFVQIDDDQHGWTIGNSLIRYSVGGEGATTVRGIVDPAEGRDWSRASEPDSFVLVNGQKITIGGSGSSGTAFVNAETSEWWGGVRLDLVYRVPAASLLIRRSYACYSGGAVIETWTTYQNQRARAIALGTLNNYALKVENGRFGWITGMDATEQDGGPFRRAESDFDDGQATDLGSADHSAEHVLPWFQIVAEDQHFFGGILWSGSWRLHVVREGDTMNVQIGLPPFSTSLGAGGSLETPHAIFGITTRAVPEVSMALRGFVDRGLRHGRPMSSYVTYNTWYSYGTFVDEASLLAEMDMAAGVGVEQFVVDAGWWSHINSDDSGDFARSWGNWEVDPDRFPDGLGALSDHAHELGMKFGVWVEPERVDFNTVGLPGLAEERFLAMSGGYYSPGVPNAEAQSAQICLADGAARQWLLGKLVAFLDEVHPDYLKWDNNFWLNCDRPTHGHGVEDGNFAHMRGLQLVRQELRDRYPDLQVEECSSGGRRLSLGTLALSDAAWLDDHTFPSNRVRQSLEGLGDIFPAPYLLSFVWPTAEEPVVDDPPFDLPFVFRSRMLGVLGMSYRADEFSEGTLAMIGREIALYKRIRPILQDGNHILLSRQVVTFPDTPFVGWDVVEHVSPTTGDAVVIAFDSPDGPSSVLVNLKGLKPQTNYAVESADYGDLGTAMGIDLMSSGIEIQSSSISRGHVLILHALTDR